MRQQTFYDLNTTSDEAGRVAVIEAVNWRKAVISEHATFQQAFQNLNDVAIKLCICVDEEGGLIGLITDGDLRRGLLRGLSMDDSVAEVINRNPWWS